MIGKVFVIAALLNAPIAMAQPGDDDFFEDEFDREDTVEVEDTFADSFEDA